MKIKTVAITAILLINGLLLTSCCSGPDSHGYVYREWSKRMAEMGIFPVYPPREDIVVGDVYALPLHPYDTAAVGYIGGLGNAGIHVDYLGDTNLQWKNFLTKLTTYYSTRPYPADSTNALISGTNVVLTSIPGYEDAQRSSAFDPGSVARLRQVSFPDFNITHIDQESLAAVIPIEGIMAGFNFNRSDIKAVHFSIPHAESYGLTTEEMLQDLYKWHYFTNTADNKLYLRGDVKEAVLSAPGARMTYAMFADIMTNVMSNPEYCIPASIRKHIAESVTRMQDKIYLALISEVYFARSMDITIERKKAGGASASARPITSAELGQLESLGLLKSHTHTNLTTTTTNTVDSNNGTNTVMAAKADMIELTDGDTAFTLAQKLRQQDTPSSLDQIGGSVRVLSVSANNIGLRRTFQRPIVVGVRGVMLKLDLNPTNFIYTTKVEAHVERSKELAYQTNPANGKASIITNEVERIVYETNQIPWMPIVGGPAAAAAAMAQAGK